MSNVIETPVGRSWKTIDALLGSFWGKIAIAFPMGILAIVLQVLGYVTLPQDAQHYGTINWPAAVAAVVGLVAMIWAGILVNYGLRDFVIAQQIKLEFTRDMVLNGGYPGVEREELFPAAKG